MSDLIVTRNTYIASRRARFARELADDNVRLQVCAMLVSEDAVMPLPVVESLFNRCDFAGKSVVQMLHSGFYGPINRGQLPRFENEVRTNKALALKMNVAIDEALAGSNVIQGYTDQGLPSDPNGKWPGMRLHGEVFNDWGGGPGGHEGARRWREAFMAGALASASATSSGGTSA